MTVWTLWMILLSRIMKISNQKPVNWTENWELFQVNMYLTTFQSFKKFPCEIYFAQTFQKNRSEKLGFEFEQYLGAIRKLRKHLGVCTQLVSKILTNTLVNKPYEQLWQP